MPRTTACSATDDGTSSQGSCWPGCFCSPCTGIARTILLITAPSTPEKFLLAPHNVHYHVDHHLYPSVPYYNLPRLHAQLLAQPEYMARAHITDGYCTGLRRECVRPAG